MITPTYNSTATERVLPSLALDFTTAVADPRVATVRAANTATRFNASGLIEIVNANLPRFDFSPTTLTCQGQLIEQARTNLFLNSLIDGTNLATQSVTLSAVAYTMSFYGSGSVTISGGHSATVAGAGDFPNRKTYTFTPTAGSSTFTVSGDVNFAQLEAGSFATSFIPTAASSVTRNADVVSMTGTNFSSWYNASEGTISVLVSDLKNTAAAALASLDFSNTNRMTLNAVSGDVLFAVRREAALQANISCGAYTSGQYQIVGAYKNNNFAAAANGNATTTDASGTIPTAIKLSIGSYNTGNLTMTGYIKKLAYYPQRLVDNEVQAFSKG